MTFTSWLKYYHEIKKIIIYVNIMLIYVNNIEKIFKNKFIYVNLCKYHRQTDRRTEKQIKSIVRNLTII